MLIGIVTLVKGSIHVKKYNVVTFLCIQNFLENVKTNIVAESRLAELFSKQNVTLWLAKHL
jgi:hypothetical protein